MVGLVQDARHALRTLAKSPGFAATALLTIALAIGATTAMFAIANGVLFRALPYADADRLVRLYSVDPSTPLERRDMSLVDLDDWQSRTGAFSATAGYLVLPQVLLGRGDPQELRTAYVTDSFFRVLASPMALGRALDEADVRSAARNIVISSGFWRSAFGGDANVIGTAVSLQGELYTIVGVAAPAFRFPAADISLWAPQTVLSDRAIGSRASRDNRDFAVLARLAPGVSVESALAEARTVAAQLATEFPATNERLSSANVVPLLATMVAQVERALILVLGVVGFIALIACANVANLLLARGTARSHEIATRFSLGASRGRVARQLLTESCVLSLLGGALGVALAFAIVRVVLALYADSLPRVEDVRIDGTVLAFALATSWAAGALFGLLPAWRIARMDPRQHLGTGRRMVGVGLRGALVAGEVALAVVLVVGATLMSRSFLTLRAVDAGFDADRVLTVTMQVNVSSVPEGTSLPAYLLERRREITERLTALPGVEYAAVTSRLPLRDGASRFTFRLAGDTAAADGDRLTADARNVSRDYFRALGIPVLRGTTPVTDAPITFGTGSDRFEGRRPIAVSASAAERFWPGEDAIGKVIDGGWFEAEVVGVVGDVRQVGLAESPGPTLYFADGPQINATGVVRSTGDPALLAGAIRAAIRELDPNQSIRSIATFRDVMADSIASDRFFTLLYVAFGTLALALAAVGVYGVVGYTVGQRTRELGLRIAVGASPIAILKHVVTDAMRPVLVGVALGSVAALLLARAIEHQLYGVEAHDPWSFFVAPLVLVAAAALACCAPARTAARIDPIVALRSE